jgi:hypothetical protein
MKIARLITDKEPIKAALALYFDTRRFDKKDTSFFKKDLEFSIDHISKVAEKIGWNKNQIKQFEKKARDLFKYTFIEDKHLAEWSNDYLLKQLSEKYHQKKDLGKIKYGHVSRSRTRS